MNRERIKNAEPCGGCGYGTCGYGTCSACLEYASMDWKIPKKFTLSNLNRGLHAHFMHGSFAPCEIDVAGRYGRAAMKVVIRLLRQAILLGLDTSPKGVKTTTIRRRAR